MRGSPHCVHLYHVLTNRLLFSCYRIALNKVLHNHLLFLALKNSWLHRGSRLGFFIIFIDVAIILLEFFDLLLLQLLLVIVIRFILQKLNGVLHLNQLLLFCHCFVVSWWELTEDRRVTWLVNIEVMQTRLLLPHSQRYILERRLPRVENICTSLCDGHLLHMPMNYLLLQQSILGQWFGPVSKHLLLLTIIIFGDLRRQGWAIDRAVLRLVRLFVLDYSLSVEEGFVEAHVSPASGCWVNLVLNNGACAPLEIVLRPVFKVLTQVLASTLTSNLCVRRRASSGLLIHWFATGLHCIILILMVILCLPFGLYQVGLVSLWMLSLILHLSHWSRCYSINLLSLSILALLYNLRGDLLLLNTLSLLLHRLSVLLLINHVHHLKHHVRVVFHEAHDLWPFVRNERRLLVLLSHRRRLNLLHKLICLVHIDQRGCRFL